MTLRSHREEGKASVKQSPAHKLPSDLKKSKYEIEDHARGYGLDFFPVIFGVLDYSEINEIAANQDFSSCYHRSGSKNALVTMAHSVGHCSCTLKPIGEPVAWYGPIVVNTQKELRVAFDEYQKGTFIKTKDRAK